MNVFNSTFSGNSADTGGGMFSTGTLTVKNSTVSGNSASTTGGGIANFDTLHLSNTILADSTQGEDCYSNTTLATDIHNLIENNADGPNQCGTPLLTSDPMLAPLGDNGGFTNTMALQPASPAINAGENASCTTSDQRGVSRAPGGQCDLGAYEYNASPMVVSILTIGANPTDADEVTFAVSFSESVSAVDSTDFSIHKTGSITGESISSVVKGQDTNYLITVATGAGIGTLKLHLNDNDSIVNAANLPLGGNGVGNGDFTNGQEYIIHETNHTPTNVSLSNTSLPENKPAAFVVGQFTTTDPDPGDTHTYTLVDGQGGEDNASFIIEGNILKTVHAFNHLTKSSLSIRVRTTDSFDASFEKVFSLTVTDLPPIFNDVPDTFWAVSYIERLFNAGITGGCGDGNYCPDEPVTRAQMAVFLLKGIHSASYQPPALGDNTGFSDVAADHWAAAWIKQLAAEAITGGCGSGNYCPEASVTRAQMAVFLLKAIHGASYSPPPATGTFADVPADHWAAAWIEQLAAEGITSGCGNGNYCPESPVTRAQMAVFLIKAFNLP
jgi:hypothetical protein